VWIAHCRFRDLDGVTRRVERKTPHGVPDEYGARAEEALRDAIVGRRPPGTGTVSGTTTLGDLLTRYIEQCRQHGELAPKSVDTYAATLDTVRPRLADIRVSEATPELLDEILRGIRRDHGPTRERQGGAELRLDRRDPGWRDRSEPGTGIAATSATQDGGKGCAGARR
jgi:hypothetical protein